MHKQNRSPISALGLVIWGVAALFFLYEFFLRTFVGSVAHQVIPDLKLNAETFSLIGSAYYIAYGVMQVPVGILADKYSIKALMFFATVVCVTSTFMFAHAGGFPDALISRLLMGLGSSFAFVCLLTIAVTWFPRQYFGFFAGTSQFIGTMGPLLAGGPLVTLMMKTHQDWRTTLSQIGIFGVGLALLILLVVRKKPRDQDGAVILLKHAEPILPRLIKLARDLQVWEVAFYSATVYVSMALLGAIWGTEYLQAVGLSQTGAATIISLAWFGYAIGCPLLGALSDIAQRRKPILIFCALLGFGATTGIISLQAQAPHSLYACLFFCVGFAASGQSLGFATITEHSDAGTRATAIGLNNAAIMLFASVVPPLVSYFIYASASVGEAAAHLTPRNFTFAFSIMPILYLLSAIMAFFFMRETYCKPQKEAIRLTVSGL